ncbi:hypothetical protein ASU33_20860 [Solirubrum puertoriconensis]|uniref:Uncharacterized protein n=1 Tax=Solirubrum puertoriconensis TaxID=1751427 RepID=A0A9X0HNK0_SOLP1|nr:hypothetical protein ASU33_20860 [Solirubrum puertoriconensis]
MNKAFSFAVLQAASIAAQDVLTSHPTSTPGSRVTMFLSSCSNEESVDGYSAIFEFRTHFRLGRWELVDIEEPDPNRPLGRSAADFSAEFMRGVAHKLREHLGKLPPASYPENGLGSKLEL